MKTTLLRACFVFFVCLLSSVSALAWNAMGHSTIAAIAYRNLDDDVKAKVDALLQAHPRFEIWKTAAEAASNDEETIALYVFMQASTWPDDIRHSGSPFDHPNWHFVDYAFTPPNKTVNPKSPMPKDDVLFGMRTSVRELEDPSNSDEERAIDLSWVIHMVGDVHQPLHCATLVNDDFPAPVGDRGGNSIFIRPATQGIKLHSFWDGLLGNTKLAATFTEPANSATTIAAAHPKSSFTATAISSSVRKWSRESYALAVDSAYLQGHIKLAPTAKTAGPIPADYTKNAEAIAEKQAALAGYRLAHVINEALAE